MIDDGVGGGGVLFREGGVGERHGGCCFVDGVGNCIGHSNFTEWIALFLTK